MSTTAGEISKLIAVNKYAKRCSTSKHISDYIFYHISIIAPYHGTMNIF